jgi:hypothetical protein
MSKKISILGCGWLGLPLGGALHNLGHPLKGSVRSSEKLKDLKKAGIEPFQIHLMPEEIIGDLLAFLDQTQVLIIDIPPGLRSDSSYDFASSIKVLLSQPTVVAIPRVIFVSSTSVFEDGLEIPFYNENDSPNGSSKSAQQLITAENHIQEKAKSSIIIRPGGLIGEDRHPIKYLAGRKDVQHPDAPVNMVHRDYLIRLMTELITMDNPPQVVHAISENQISRKDFYTQAAQDRGLEAPLFDTQTPSLGKKIVSLYQI